MTVIHCFFIIFHYVSLYCKLVPVQYRRYEYHQFTIDSTFFSVGGRPLMSSKGNQISSSPYPLPCERKVLFSETSECQSCWKLSSWDRNKTRLECRYCCGDAEGESCYDCLTFIPFFASSLYYPYSHVHILYL